MGKCTKEERQKKLIARRFSRYKKFGFLSLTENGGAYCKCCDSVISRLKKYNIEHHVKSEKHKRNLTLCQDLDNSEDMVIESIDSKAFADPVMNTAEKKQKVSNLMGEYLLKGYTMLRTNCDDCNCVLFKDNKKRTFCIECELMSTFPSPKLSTIYINEEEGATEAEQNLPTEVKYLPKQSEKKKSNASIFIQDGRSPILISENRLGSINGVPVGDEVSSAVSALKKKLTWASHELDESKELKECQQAAATITQITNALVALKSVSS